MSRGRETPFAPETNNRLMSLAADIRATHAAITKATVEVAEQVIAAGAMLNEAKAGVQHGQWDRWVRDHTGLTLRTARRYMQIARSGLAAATVAELGVRGATEQLARATVRPVGDVDNDPAYLAWRDEMLEGLRRAPTQAVRDRFLSLVREQVAAEQFGVWLRERAGPGEVEKLSGWLERADKGELVRLLEAAVKAGEGRS